jgi:hypothetical protein
MAKRKNKTTTSPHVDQEAAMKAIADIRQALPFMKDLTTDQRNSIPKIGAKGVAFIHKAVAVAEQNPQILPPSVTLDNMSANSNLLDTLTAILIALDQLRKQLSDTAVFVRNEAYTAARCVYTYAAAAGPGLETAVEELGQYFTRKSNGVVKPNPPDPQPAASVLQT